MVVSCSPSNYSLRRFAIAIFALALASFPITAKAQSDSHSAYSSSDDNKSYLAGEDIDGASMSADPVAAPKPQYGQTNTGYPAYQSRWSHAAFEAGGGFTAPTSIGGDFVTYGYNLTLGGGWNFNKRFGALVEYQFNRNKIPGATLAAVGAPGGNVNTWSFTIDPIFYYANNGKIGGYVTGGGGFYRKVTNYTEPVPSLYCDYFYGYCGYIYQNQTIGHFSSNQGGLNIGTGVTWNAFGPDSKAKLYAEARYVWVDSPSETSTQQGTGTEGLIPVTFGIRF